MSFLSSVLSSIETGKPAPIPPPAPRSPAPPGSGAAPKRDAQKPVSASNAPTRSANTASAGTKRKAEEQLHRPDKPNGPATSKAPSATSAAAKTQPKSSTQNNSPAPKPTPAADPSRPPPKGSFADLMLKAKAVQEKAPKVGVLKHQPVPKEKLSKAEKKRRAMEALAKEKEARSAKKLTSSPSAAAKTGAKPGEGHSIKRREPEENTYKGTARPLQPEYKGTAGLPSRHMAAGRGRADPRRGKPSRMDEYLGTDEEDEGDYYADDYDDYYSDDLSDMEAGLEDVEREEALALEAARREDEEDIKRELAAKKEKMERKKKLAALAKSKR
ncbi:hypothetical protein VTN77DRAFT_4916 [Rasamsonia byssochlamydoides]|uniref:uncharacterized protein n=1 Tax=Rasamsonia byssochlamydoides TaxID=89139 RepID=UPI0037436275